jgi:ABC-type Co2+ transport system permease subunit
METRTRSAWIAVCLGPVATVVAVVRQLINGLWWPYWVDDLLIGVLLTVAGWLVLRESSSTRARMLSAGWGAMLLVLWGSTFRHVEGLPSEGYTPHLTLITIAMLGLLGLAVLGLFWSLPTTQKPFIGTRPPKEKT